MKRTLLLVLLLGCHQDPVGTLGGRCKPDGTCTGEHLFCNGTDECAPSNMPQPVNMGNCFPESVCFCQRCAESCGDAGLKACQYTDTSVWGSKPATCECR